MFDLVAQSIRLENVGLDKRELNTKDVEQFKKKVEKNLEEGWKLEQFSSSEMKGIPLFVQTFTK